MKSAFNKIAILLIVISIPFSVYLLSLKTNFFGGASGIPANIVVDASISDDSKIDSWRNLAQGGEERNRQLLPVVDKVKVLRPKYIRIDHVFDSYTEEQLIQNINDITATGAKPFISLSYMPANLAKNGDITSLPTDWVAWENLVTRTVERISGKGGLNISGVYYEVWNEPDLFGKYKVYGSKNYLDLYAHTARAISRATNVNPYKVGGPATTGFYESWFSKLTQLAASNNLRLDFISWHLYSKDLEKYEDTLISLVHYPGKELIISELGPNSENDPVYDNNFSAIHTIATTAVLEGKIDKLFNFEIKDGVGKDKYWGRWGMLTHEKWGTPEIKPRYRAIQFLNNLNGGSNLKIGGNGSWVKAIAKQQKNQQGQITKLQVLIVNYDKQSRHSEAVPLKIENLPFTNFTLKRIDFNGQTTSSKISLESNVYDSTMYFTPNTATILELTF